MKNILTFNIKPYLFVYNPNKVSKLCKIIKVQQNFFSNNFQSDLRRIIQEYENLL